MDVEKTLASLKRNNMQGFYLENRSGLFPLLGTLIPDGSSVGWGDSVTLEQLGVYGNMRDKGYNLYDKHKLGLSKEEKRNIYLACFGVDTFLTGVNAITADGKLFNIDGNGSRVAPMLYGPKQVIVIAGVNKITDTVEDAVKRARQTAAPLDAKRLGRHTPCVRLGYCTDCHHEQRICNDFVLITGQFVKDRIKVILINEALGY